MGGIILGQRVQDLELQCLWERGIRVEMVSDVATKEVIFGCLRLWLRFLPIFGICLGGCLVSVRM